MEILISVDWVVLSADLSHSSQQQDQAQQVTVPDALEKLNIKALHDAGIKGAGVVIAIMDTGNAFYLLSRQPW